MATPSQPPVPDDATDAAAPGPMHAALDHASAAGDRVQQGFASARETLGHCVDEICLMTDECADDARYAVRARPLTAVLAALAVGLLIGRLSR